MRVVLSGVESLYSIPIFKNIGYIAVDCGESTAQSDYFQDK